MTWILIVAGVTLSIHLAIALYSQHIVKRHVSLNLSVYEQAPPPLPTAASLEKDEPKNPFRPSALHEWPPDTRLTAAIDPYTGKPIRVVLVEEADRIHNALVQEHNIKHN